MALSYTVRKTDRLLRLNTTADNIVVTLLPFAQTPNAPYEVHRTSFGDGHTVTIRVNPGTADFLLPDGSTSIVLDDTIHSAIIKIPADGHSPAFCNTGGGSSGGGGGTTDAGFNAPELVSVAAAAVYSLQSSASAFSFDGDIVVDDLNALWPNTGSISVVAYGPSALSGAEIAHLVAPFTVLAGHKVHFTGEQGLFLQSTSAESWKVACTVWDKAGHAGAVPVNSSPIPVGARTVASVTALAEIPPRFQDQNQGLLTRLTVTVALTNGQVPQNVTFWLARNGNWVLQGWDLVTVSPATITLPLLLNNPNGGFYVPQGAPETWIVAAAVGTYTDQQPPLGVAVDSGPITVPVVGLCSASGVTAATSSASITFTDGIGVPDWRIPLVQWTDPLIDPAHSGSANYDVNCWFTVLTFQCTDSLGNPAPGAVSANDQGGDEVEIARAPVLGGKLQSSSGIDSFGFNPVGSIFTYACLRIYSVNRLSTTSWRDPVNAKRQTSCWSAAAGQTVITASGDQALLVPFGSVPSVSLAPSPSAPNLTAFTISHTSGTEADYSTEGGLPKWSFHGTLTLPNPYTAIKNIHLTIQGLPEILVIPAVKFAPPDLSGLVLSYTTPTFLRDVASFSYTVNAWVENADGILTGSPLTAALHVTGTAPPFASTAPPSPQLLTASMTQALVQVNGVPYFSPTAHMTLVTTDPNLARINIYMPAFRPVGWVWSFDRPASGWPSSPYDVLLSALNQDVLDHTGANAYAWEMRTCNTDFVERVPGLTGTLAVPAATGNFTPPVGVLPVSSVSIAEVAGTRIRRPDYTTQVTIRVTITLPANVGVQNYSAFYGDDGVSGGPASNFLWTNWYPVGGTSGTFDLTKVVPAATKYVQVAIVPGAISGDPNTFITLANLPAGRTLSNILTLAPVAAPSATAILSATFATPPTQMVDPNGAQDWMLPDITITDASPVVDPYAKFSRLIVYICNSAGNPASAADGGQDQLVAMFDVDGSTHHCNSVAGWGYPGNPAFTSPPVDRARFRVEVVNAAGAATVENCWGAAAFKDAVFGNAPTGAMPANRMDPTTWGPGIIPDPVNQKPTGAGPSPSTSMLYDWDFRLSYPNTVPSVAWAYSGVTITTGGINGGPYATLHGASAFIQQKFPCAPSQPLYFQVAAQGHGAGSLALTCQFYDTNNNFISATVNVGTVSGGSGWVAGAISGTIPGGSVPPNATTARFTLQVTAGGSDVWDITACIVRQVVQQTNNGVTDTLAGPSPGYNPISTITTASGLFNSTACQLVASDGSQIALIPFAGSPQVQIWRGGSPGNQINLQVFSGGPNIQLMVAGTAFNGYNGTVQDNLGTNHTVKCGLIVT